MARAGHIKVKGSEVLSRKLRALPEVVERAAKQAVKEETHDAAMDMRRDAPVLTGDLVRSIQEEILRKGMVGRAAVTDPAAEQIVHGTSDTPAHDFVTPAIERVRRRFPDRLKSIARAELKRM